TGMATQAPSPPAARSTPRLGAAVACLALAFVALFALSMSADFLWASHEQAARYFTPDEIERGLTYARERRLLSWCSIGLQLALLTALVCTPWARRLTDRVDRWTGRRWLLTLLGVAAVYQVLSQLLVLPVVLGQYQLAHHWNMTSQNVGAFLLDYAKGL